MGCVERHTYLLLQARFQLVVIRDEKSQGSHFEGVSQDPVLGLFLFKTGSVN